MNWKGMVLVGLLAGAGLLLAGCPGGGGGGGHDDDVTYSASDQVGTWSDGTVTVVIAADGSLTSSGGDHGDGTGTSTITSKGVVTMQIHFDSGVDMTATGQMNAKKTSISGTYTDSDGENGTFTFTKQ